MKLPPLILASASPRRADLLRELNLKFRVVVARVEEAASRQLTPRELCLINACRKARAVAEREPDALVLGADTTVCLGARNFGKPRDAAEAFRMLAALQARTHEVLTAVCLLHWRQRRQQVFVDATDVTFRPLTPGQIRAYLRKVHVLDKAGAYGIQEEGHLLVERISGSFSNVVGLPLERLKEALENWKRD